MFNISVRKITFFFRQVSQFINRRLTFRTWLFLVFSLFLIGIGIFILHKTLTGKSAEWFNEDYTYRQRIPISNSGSAQTNFQVGVTVNTSSLITAGKMQSDCDDIRFTAQNGEELPHWIEENNPGCNQTNTRIWVKVTNIPAGNSNMYMYYGNASASAASGGGKVFPFFDDFNATALDNGKYGATGSYSFSGGALTITTGSIYTKSPVLSEAQGYIFETRRKWDSTSGQNAGMQISDVDGPQGNNAGSNKLIYFMSQNATLDINSWAADGTTTGYNLLSNATGYTATAGTYYIDGFSMDSSTIRFYMNRSVGNTVSGTWSAAPYLNLGMFTGSGAGTTDIRNYTTDWVLARKFAATEPTIGAFGPEETGPAPIGYWKMNEGVGSTTYNSADSTAATITQAVWQSEDLCISGKCLYFDGTDDIVDTGKDFSWSQSESFSMSGWVNMKRAANASVWGKGTTGTTWEWSMKVAGSSPLFTYWNTAGGEAISITSSLPITMNRWHHIAVTYSGTNAEANYFVDGNKTATQTGITGTFQNRANNVNIGNAYWSNSSAGPFPGMVDELKIYNYERTPEEIKTEFIRGASGKGSAAVLGASAVTTLNDGLMGYWKMDEVGVSGSGWTAVDSSGNNNNGTGAGNIVGVQGKFGYGAGAGGSVDYIEADGVSSTFNPSEGSMCVWAYPEDSTSEETVISFSSSINGNQGINITNDTGAWKITYDNNIPFQLSSGFVFELNKWTHLCTTWEERKLRGYQNGKFIDMKAITSEIAGTIDRFTMGGLQNDGIFINGFKGKLDEVRVYNRALSEREISLLYNWAPGPVAYYPLDENTGTKANDKSGNNNIGTLTSGPSWNPGKYGPSVNFDGSDDYIEVPDNSILDLTGAVTVSAWVYPTVSGTSTILAKIGSGGGYGSGGYQFIWNNDTGYSDGNQRICFLRADGVAGTGGGNYGSNTNWSRVCTDTILSTSQWYFVEGVWDGTTGTDNMKIYLNGKLNGTYTSTKSTTTANNLNLFIGRTYYTSAFQQYAGLIDDVRIYNYARTQKQIVADMNASHPNVGSPVASPLVYFKFDEGYGSTSRNSGNAGVGLTGTMATGTSAPTWTNEGKFGKALSFDGTSDYIGLQSSGLDFTTGQSFSISAWIKPEDKNNYGFIFGKASSGTNGYALATDNVDHYYLAADSGYRSSKQTINYGIWNHIVGVWDYTGSTYDLKLYINGNQDIGGTSVSTSTITSAAVTPKLGVRGDISNFFKGTLDEIKVYSYALTDNEVQVEYNQGKAIVLGSSSTGVGGTTPSYASSREYCVPGDDTSCAAPVAEWKFAENTGTSTSYDTSGNGNHASLISITGSSWSPGLRDSALYFDGVADSGTMPHSSLYNFDTDENFTLTTWLKIPTTDQPDTSGSVNEIIQKWGGGNYPFLLRYNNQTAGVDQKKLQVARYDGTNNPAITSLNTVNDAGWHHIAFTKSGETLAFYIDSVLQGTTSDTTSASTANTAPIVISKRYNSLRFFQGFIDDIKIYNYARTPAQIAWEYNKGAPRFHYKMDECEGTTIYNSARTFTNAPAGNNGTLNIGATGGNTTAGTCSTSGAWANGATGKRGASIDFDGTDDYVEIGDAFYSDALSMCAWIKPDNPDKYNMIVIKRNSSGGSSGTVEWWFYVVLQKLNWVSNNASGAVTVQVISDKSITTGNWQHVCAVQQGTGQNAYVYINGQQTGSALQGDAMRDANSVIQIGARSNSDDTRYFDGQIDDVRIYNFALTPQQVKSEFNNGAVRFE